MKRRPILQRVLPRKPRVGVAVRFHVRSKECKDLIGCVLNSIACVRGLLRSRAIARLPNGDTANRPPQSQTCCDNGGPLGSRQGRTRQPLPPRRRTIRMYLPRNRRIRSLANQQHLQAKPQTRLVNRPLVNSQRPKKWTNHPLTKSLQRPRATPMIRLAARQLVKSLRPNSQRPKKWTNHPLT